METVQAVSRYGADHSEMKSDVQCTCLNYRIEMHPFGFKYIYDDITCYRAGNTVDQSVNELIAQISD